MSDFARDEELSEHEEVIEEVQERHGGPQTDDEEDDGQDDEKRKMEERERKKAEVRKRLEDSNKKKAKKGFLTPERKKKLRKLLMLKAAEDLKQQQVLKEQERKNCLEKRIIKLPANLDTIENQGELEKIAQTMVDKIKEIENTKYDLDFVVRAKDHEINELSIAVNDLRGKFVKPPLKKVSKYDNKFKKLADAQKKEEQPNFRANLKKSQDKTALLLESLTKDKKSEEAPEWAKKGSSHDKPPEEAEVEAPEEEE